MSAGARAVVTGLGAITPNGLDLASTWASVVEGRSGIRALETVDVSDLSVKVGGEVRGFDPLAHVSQVGRPSPRPPRALRDRGRRRGAAGLHGRRPDALRHHRRDRLWRGLAHPRRRARPRRARPASRAAGRRALRRAGRRRRLPQRAPRRARRERRHLGDVRERCRRARRRAPHHPARLRRCGARRRRGRLPQPREPRRERHPRLARGGLRDRAVARIPPLRPRPHRLRHVGRRGRAAGGVRAARAPSRRRGARRAGRLRRHLRRLPRHRAHGPTARGAAAAMRRRSTTRASRPPTSTTSTRTARAPR